MSSESNRSRDRHRGQHGRLGVQLDAGARRLATAPAAESAAPAIRAWECS